MRLGLCLLSLVCGGCTALALSDEIHQSNCQENVDCEILNDRTSREFNPCRIWQCDARSKLCVFEQTDLDQDGVPPPFCVDVGTRGDCDDTDPSINPKAKEVCDGADNDCDQSVDEGMLAVSHDSALRFDDDVSELDYAWNPTSSELGVIYRKVTDDRVGFNVLGRSRTSSGEPLLFSNDRMDVRGSALATTVRVGHFLAGLVEADASRRVWVGDVTSDIGRSLLRLGPGMRERGLHCASDEFCPGDLPPMSSTRPRLSVLSDRVLAAYTRYTEWGGCGSDSGRAILINLLTETGAGAQETTDKASTLDYTTDTRGPALVPIARGIEPFGWLAAYPNAAGDLIIQRVTAPPGGTLSMQRALRLQRGEQPISNVQLALGSSEEDRVTLGLAAQSGCGAQARVLFGVLQLTWDDTGRTELRVYREPRMIADEPAEQPVLGYNASYSDWGVAYANDDGLFVRVLDRNGLSVGGEAYRISDGRPTVADYAVVPGTAGGLFGVYSYAQERTLEVASLQACAPPP